MFIYNDKYSNYNNINREYNEEITLTSYNINNLNNNIKRKNPTSDFISELRKMSHSKENNNFKKNIIIQKFSNSLYRSKSQLNISSYSSSFRENKEKILSLKNNNNYNNYRYNNNDTSEKSDLNLSKTLNKKYNFKNENLKMNFQYGTNDKDINKINLNKYLKDPNYSTKKVKKYKEMNFEYILNKENININNNNINYKSPPNTDRYSYKNYSYEEKNENKENNNNKNNILKDENIKKENKINNEDNMIVNQTK